MRRGERIPTCSVAFLGLIDLSHILQTLLMVGLIVILNWKKSQILFCLFVFVWCCILLGLLFLPLSVFSPANRGNAIRSKGSVFIIQSIRQIRLAVLFPKFEVVPRECYRRSSYEFFIKNSFDFFFLAQGFKILPQSHGDLANISLSSLSSSFCYASVRVFLLHRFLAMKESKLLLCFVSDQT